MALVPPVWSPDGQRLAFVANEGEVYAQDQRDVYTIRPDGSELTKVGETGPLRFAHNHLTAAPTWSPDGERLAFQGLIGEDLAIYTVRFDGSELRLVWYSEEEAHLTRVSQLSWSPDGSELLIVGSDRAQSASGEYVVNLDDSSLRQLPRLPSELPQWAGLYSTAEWSPDGTEVAIYVGDTWWSSIGESSRFFLYTIDRYGTDSRFLVEVDGDGRLQAVHPTEAEATTGPESESPTVVPAEPTVAPILE